MTTPARPSTRRLRWCVFFPVVRGLLVGRRSILLAVPRPFRSVAEKFWEYVDTSDGPDACWPWLGARNDTGYGIVAGNAGRQLRAHRWSYESAFGSIPLAMVIDHECHNRDASCPGGVACPHRRCVNPAHLAAVSRGENLAASSRAVPTVNAAKTHCPQGHPYDAANTIRKSGRAAARYAGRRCRACQNAARRRRRATMRASAGQMM